MKDQFTGVNIKQVKIKEYKHFHKSNFVRVNRLFVLVYLNQDADSKKQIYQKSSTKIMWSSMEKVFMIKQLKKLEN